MNFSVLFPPSLTQDTEVVPREMAYNYISRFTLTLAVQLKQKNEIDGETDLIDSNTKIKQ